MVSDAGLLHGSCLCGDVTYQSMQTHDEMWNCHCHSCRKASSVAYATWIRARSSSFSWLTLNSPISLRHSSATMLRSFCSRCGSVLPAYSEQDDSVFLPASGISTPHDLSPSADRYTDEMPSWYAMTGHQPCQDATGSQPEDSPTGVNEGSCLCGSIKYRVEGEADAIRACHCSRCRQRSGSAFFAALPVLISDFHLEGDAENISSFFLPDSKYYGYSFCSDCGTVIPSVFPGGKRAVIGAGSLDTSPPLGLKYHIYCGSRASWTQLGPQETCFHEEPPVNFDWRNTSNVSE